MIQRLALCVSVIAVCVVPVACANKGGSETTSDVRQDLPPDCTTYLAAYSACVGRLGTQARGLAEQSASQTRAAFLDQLHAAGGANAVEAQCTAALHHLNAACH